MKDIDERLQDEVHDGLEVVLGQGGLEHEHVEEAVEGHRLELAQLALVVVEEAAGDEAEHLVKQVDLVGVVSGIARVTHKQNDQLDEGVQALVAQLSLAFGQVEVARLDAGLGANAEEASDHVIYFFLVRRK